MRCWWSWGKEMNVWYVNIRKICREYGCKGKSISKGKRQYQKKIGKSRSNDFVYQYGVSQDG